jgi:hypothetical protein
MSEKIVNAVKTKIGKLGSLRGKNRRTVIIVAIVACVLIGFFIATSVTTVSKLTITVVNYSDEDLLFRVYVDDFGERHDVLEPNESLTFLWNLTAWLHKYAIFAHPPGMLISWYPIWVHFIVLPFSEKEVISIEY